MLNEMSTSSSLRVSSQGALDLPVGRDAPRDRTSSRRGLLAIAGLLLTGVIIAVGGAHTTALLPQSVQFVPASLGGIFDGVGLNLHTGGAIAALALFFVAYAFTVSLSAQLSARVVLGAIAALTLLVLIAPPLVSTDIFSYQAYARMGGLYGINPYTHGPYAISFDNALFPYIGSKWSYIPSAYGPVFTVFSYVMAPLAVAASVFAYKAIAAVSCLALVALVWQCARLRGKDPVRAAALVGLNPLVVIYGVGGGHNDLLMLVALVGGLYAVLASRERLGGALMVLASGIKLTAGITLPFAILADGRRRGRGRRDLIIGAAIGLAMVAALSLVVFGAQSVDMLKTINQSQSEGDWQTLPGFIGVGLGLVTVAHIVSYVLALVFIVITCRLLLRVWRGEMDWIDGAGWATLAMLLASSSLLPWYVGWLLPLAALGHDRRLTRWTLIMTGVVQGFQLVGYIPHAIGLL
jgi:alpha-1,6-mannosyltransferase